MGKKKLPSLDEGGKNMVCQIYFSDKLFVILSVKQHKDKIFRTKQQREHYMVSVWKALGPWEIDT